MVKVIRPILIIFVLFLSKTVFAQTLHEVQVTNFSFTPSELTVLEGDTVRWTNIAGFHNVVSDEDLFTSGALSSANWVYEFVFTNIGNYPYYCAAHGGPGGSGMSGVVIVETSTGIEAQVAPNNNFQLTQNYPNPFNPTTRFSYSLAEAVKVSVKIFNMLGAEVQTLVDEVKPAGNYEVNFDASDLSSGIYFYRLQAGANIQTRKMILVR